MNVIGQLARQQPSWLARNSKLVLEFLASQLASWHEIILVADRQRMVRNE